MKKLSLMLSAALFGAFAANAQDPVVANPTLEDGSFVVKYDMENHKFAESNDFEVDETFVFAVDITGTPFVEALTTTGRNPAVLGRGMARDIYASKDVNNFPHFEAGGNLDGRMFHIEGNIYGMCINLLQYAQGLYKDGPFGYISATEYDACEPGAVMTFGCNVFPFGWSATNQGEEWWDAISTPITTLWFHTAPYTGTKTGEEFYFDDFTKGEAFPGCADSANADKGWCMPEYFSQLSGAGVEAVEAAAEGEAEYFNLQGLPVSHPEEGIYICRRGAKVSKIMVRK